MRYSPIVARASAGVVALLALAATISAVPTVLVNESTLPFAEPWRVVGLATFTALFTLLATSQTHNYRLWEILIASKLTLVILAIGPSRATAGASDALLWDTIVVVLLALGYTCARRAKSTSKPL